MSDLLLSELLILFCLIPVIIRPVFLRSHRVDSIVLVAPVTFLLCVILFFAYTFTLTIGIVSFFTLLVLLSNFRALLRYSYKLYVDYYSVKFRIAMIIEFFALIFFVVILVFFAPVPIQKHSTRVFSGSCARGFKEKQSLFMPSNLFLTKFEDPSMKEQTKAFNAKPVILYIPHVYSSTYDASPRLEALAAKGYTVICAEFFSDDLKYFNTLANLRVFRTFALQVIKPQGNFTTAREVQKKAALELVTLLYGKTIFYDPILDEPTPLMDDIYLTRPFMAWIMDRDNYQHLKKEAKTVPEQFANAIEQHSK